MRIEYPLAVSRLPEILRDGRPDWLISDASGWPIACAFEESLAMLIVKNLSENAGAKPAN